MQLKTILVVTASFAVLSGCSEDASQAPVATSEAATSVVQTVSWYLEHDAEREALVKRCKDNRGELEKDPNCLNAREADFIHMQERIMQIGGK
ncbi:EexN family lipoprotein [Neorhizobium sp. T786]|uniref:EexN family lipoprotein n=1 Tax=Pseudorhizobium xiangyangii TaxID=2883104 RepID=UPI001CFFD1AC|nr:EexN family lipoprotein [Neorhizobium xiangyangii]MCB5205165.1 EexN family lipoprotein [Neorhizobium xiangyangii]